MMAAGYSSRVLEAIASLGDDGVVVCPEDHDKFAALIGDYFNETDNDDSGSEDVECGKRVIFPQNVVYIPLTRSGCSAQRRHRRCTRIR